MHAIGRALLQMQQQHVISDDVQTGGLSHSQLVITNVSGTDSGQHSSGKSLNDILPGCCHKTPASFSLLLLLPPSLSSSLPPSLPLLLSPPPPPPSHNRPPLCDDTTIKQCRNTPGNGTIKTDSSKACWINVSEMSWEVVYTCSRDIQGNNSFG